MLSFDDMLNLSYNQRLEDIESLAVQLKEIGELGPSHNATVYDYSTNKLYMNGHIVKVACILTDKHITKCDAYICVQFEDINKVLHINILDLEEHTMTKKVNKEERRVKVFLPCLKIFKIQTIQEFEDEQNIE